jgi:hypothetical protein
MMAMQSTLNAFMVSSKPPWACSQATAPTATPAAVKPTTAFLSRAVSR